MGINSSIKTGSFDDVMSRNGHIEDCSNNGICSNCGGCCNDIIPLSNGDINRIKQYVKKHNIKPINHCLLQPNALDTVCPFRDENENKCVIYEVRPYICRIFSCHNYPYWLINHVNDYKRHKIGKARSIKEAIYN